MSTIDLINIDIFVDNFFLKYKYLNKLCELMHISNLYFKIEMF